MVALFGIQCYTNRQPLSLEAQDHEVSMSQNSLDSIIKYATELKQKMGEMEKDIPAWIQDHITNAENYISQASSNYHDYDGISESINEVDGMLNKKVYKLLMKELGDLRTGGPNHQFAVMHVLIGALRDANFLSDAKKVPALFPKADYEGEFVSEDNEIIIYSKNITSKSDLAKTIVHEYAHYLQSPVWMTRYYTMGHTYRTHPYEKQAFLLEDLNWLEVCR